MKLKRQFPRFSVLPLTVVLLLIEFFDELHYALGGAALPSIQRDLALDYAQIGLLLGLPHLIGVMIEWFLMLLGDTHLRKALIVGGGLAVSLAVILIGSAPASEQGFWVILGATILAFPASGAFVTLAQSSLMDLHPGKEERMMARWSLSGSLGNLGGPLLLAGVLVIGLTWRWGYFLLATSALLLSCLTAFSRFPIPAAAAPGAPWRVQFRTMAGGIMSAVRSAVLVRWLVLLEVADLLMDVFLSYAPLYFANVAGLDAVQTSLALGAMMAGSVLADLIAVPLLEVVRGRSLVRITAAFSALLFTAFLTLPGVWTKIILAVLLRLSTMGWYAILKAEAYAALPGRSGTVNALNSVSGLISGAIPWVVGLAAQKWGLASAMWLLLIGPLALVAFVPRKGQKDISVHHIK